MKKFLSIVLLLPLLLILHAQGTAAAKGDIERLDGADRFEVAVHISKKGWPTAANTVILTNYLAFADALSAAPLAYSKNAPILLTHQDRLTEATKTEIRRLSPKEVIIIGSEGSVSDRVASDLRDLNVSDVRRIGGSDRFAVSAAIASELPSSSKVVVADGTNFPDALSVAPYAARNGYPILLARPASLPGEIKQALLARNPDSSIVAGGTSSVSTAVTDQLPSPMRIGGKDRYEVAANVIKQLNLNTSKAFMATGLTFADALTGSVLAAKQNAPLLLTHSQFLPAPTKKVIIDKTIMNFTVLGGLPSVPQKVMDQAVGIVGMKIVVDAGHGGKDPGASANGLVEKDVTLDVAKRLNSKLAAQGAKVTLTRSGDTYPTLDERAAFANRIGADVFVSIHINAAGAASAAGTETYWNSQYASAESKELATYIQKEMVAELGTRDRSVKEANFVVIKETKMASALAELAFVTNSGDANMLKSTTYRDKAAKAIFEGVSIYWSRQ